MNKKRTQYNEDEKNNEEKKTMQRGGVIELNILKQTSIKEHNICSYTKQCLIGARRTDVLWI